MPWLRRHHRRLGSRIQVSIFPCPMLGAEKIIVANPSRDYTPLVAPYPSPSPSPSKTHPPPPRLLVPSRGPRFPIGVYLSSASRPLPCNRQSFARLDLLPPGGSAVERSCHPWQRRRNVYPARIGNLVVRSAPNEGERKMKIRTVSGCFLSSLGLPCNVAGTKLAGDECELRELWGQGSKHWKGSRAGSSWLGNRPGFRSWRTFPGPCSVPSGWVA